jgi:hypothetical protein
MFKQYIDALPMVLQLLGGGFALLLISVGAAVVFNKVFVWIKTKEIKQGKYLQQMLIEHTKNNIGKKTIFGTLRDDWDGWEHLDLIVGEDGWPKFRSLPGGWVPRRNDGRVKLGQLGILVASGETHFTNIVTVYDDQGQLRLVAYKASRGNASMHGYHAVIQGMIEAEPSFDKPPSNPNKAGIRQTVLQTQ